MKPFSEYLAEGNKASVVTESTELLVEAKATPDSIIKAIAKSFKIKGTFKIVPENTKEGAFEQRIQAVCASVPPEYQAFGDKLTIDVSLKPQHRGTDDLEGKASMGCWHKGKKTMFPFCEVEVSASTGKVSLYNIS